LDHGCLLVFDLVFDVGLEKELSARSIFCQKDTPLAGKFVYNADVMTGV